MWGAGCTGTKARDPASPADAPERALLGLANVQADPAASVFYAASPGEVAEDAEAYVIHEDFYGIPWTSLLAGEAPPDAWVAAMDLLADDARGSGLPVMLALSLVQGPGRTHLGSQAVVQDGVLVSPEAAWSERCYDFATAADADVLEAAYLDYLTWMIQRFEPRWLNVATEINLFQTQCPDAWPGLAQVQGAAYHHARSMDPELVVFASVELSHLYGLEGDCADPDACFEENLAAMALLEGDRLALSTYPFGRPDISSPADIPPDWLSRAAEAMEMPVLIAETGWSGAPIVAAFDGDCVSFGDFSEADQVAYLRWLVDQADALDMELVTWWSNRDLIPARISDTCGCAAEDQAWCDAIGVFNTVFGEYIGEITFKYWGTMGLRSYDGTAKPELMARWDQLRAE